MTVRSFASKSIAVLLYVAYAMLPVGLALLAAGLLNANARPLDRLTPSPKAAASHANSLNPTHSSAPVTTSSMGTYPASIPPAHAGGVSTSSASSGQREAVRGVTESTRFR